MPEKDYDNINQLISKCLTLMNQKNFTEAINYCNKSNLFTI